MFVLKEIEQNGAGTEKLSGKQRGFGEDTILRQNHIMGKKNIITTLFWNGRYCSSLFLQNTNEVNSKNVCVCWE